MISLRNDACHIAVDKLHSLKEQLCQTLTHYRNVCVTAQSMENFFRPNHFFRTSEPHAGPYRMIKMTNEAAIRSSQIL